MPIPDGVSEQSSSRGKRRSHHACLPCRRKKIRCPGEKPACSSCSRLQQQCSYAPIHSRSHRSEVRLASLEEKLDLLLSGGLPSPVTRQDQSQDEVAHGSERSSSMTPQAPDMNQATSQPFMLRFDSDDSNLRPGLSDIKIALDLYFEYCHRQPVWCFQREEVTDFSSLPGELTCSILALTSRFSHNRDRQQHYGRNAKPWIMYRITQGTVQLETIEALCLLSFSYFMDGDIHLGRFHVGLALQLCRSAMLDIEAVYALENATTERKKRLFWSLQLLEQFYGRQSGLLSISTELWRPSWSSTGKGTRTQISQEPKCPPLPRDDLGCTAPCEPGIWNTSIHLGWVWSRARKYLSDCAHNIPKEPWRHDSMYAMVTSDFMETENQIPMCHRYDTVKFFDRKVDELKMNRDYWATWLKEQFTYHAIPAVLNHPFLYIVGAQRNPNLASPHTFWRRSSELALLHSTWIVRMIEMITDKQLPLTDPFFAHVAAIAATVHLYYCCAANTGLKTKSNTDFLKCRRFIKSFLSFSNACGALDQTLDKITRIATGSENMDVEDWLPSKLNLSVPLMWDILQFNCMTDSGDSSTNLLDPSLAPAVAYESPDESSTLEIIIATSPEITINTADGGQDAPVSSSRAPPSASATEPSTNTVSNDFVAEQTDNLTLNTTPWLWADPSQFVNVIDMSYHDTSQSVAGEGAGWWDVGNFTNTMFNRF